MEMVSADLQRELPCVRGFLSRNRWDIRQLYESYTAPEFLAQAVRDFDHRGTKRILRQLVAEFDQDRNRLHPVAKLSDTRVFAFLQQLFAEIHGLITRRGKEDEIDG